jgi:hypothetical protein
VSAVTVRWAKRQLLAELREVREIGLACNVQEWARVGVKKSVALCRERRRQARRLLAIAIAAVEAAS